jgi:hypothetical protein
VVALVVGHRRRCLRLLVVHAGVRALRSLQVAQHVGEARAACAGDQGRVGRIELRRRGWYRHTVLGELVDPVRGVLLLDLRELQQRIASVALDRAGERAIEHGSTALRLEVPQEALRVGGHRQPLPSVLPASAAAGSSRR